MCILYRKFIYTYSFGFYAIYIKHSFQEQELGIISGNKYIQPFQIVLL